SARAASQKPDPPHLRRLLRFYSERRGEEATGNHPDKGASFHGQNPSPTSPRRLGRSSSCNGSRRSPLGALLLRARVVLSLLRARCPALLGHLANNARFSLNCT